MITNALGAMITNALGAMLTTALGVMLWYVARAGLREFNNA